LKIPVADHLDELGAQRLRRAADARAPHFGVDDDGPRLIGIGIGVNVGVADAFQMRQHRQLHVRHLAQFLEEQSDEVAEGDGVVDLPVAIGGGDTVVFPEEVFEFAEAVHGGAEFQEDDARPSGDQPMAVMDLDAHGAEPCLLHYRRRGWRLSGFPFEFPLKLGHLGFDLFQLVLIPDQCSFQEGLVVGCHRAKCIIERPTNEPKL